AVATFLAHQADATPAGGAGERTSRAIRSRLEDDVDGVTRPRPQVDRPVDPAAIASCGRRIDHARERLPAIDGHAEADPAAIGMALLVAVHAGAEAEPPVRGHVEPEAHRRAGRRDEGVVRGAAARAVSGLQDRAPDVSRGLPLD